MVIQFILIILFLLKIINKNILKLINKIEMKTDVKFMTSTCLKREEFYSPCNRIMISDCVLHIFYKAFIL